MKLEKRIALLQKHNAILNKSLEEAKKEIENKQQENTEIYNKEHELIENLESLKNDMNDVFTEMNILKDEYKKNIYTLKMCIEMLYKGKFKLPLKVRIKMKFTNLKMMILRGIK